MKSISELLIKWTKGTTMIIISLFPLHPFSLSNDDTVTNGIALSPTLHRAFDRGLIHITPDYKVKVSAVVNDTDSNFTLTQFNDREIFLPIRDSWYPSVESLSWHKEHIFLG